MPEIELKFELPVEAFNALAHAPALAGARASRDRLLALYFDTPGRDLARRRMALRLRRTGKRWNQALKAGASGTGGLHARDEWEMATRGASLDLSRFASTPLAKIPHARTLHRRLTEAFRVEVERTRWRITAAPGSRVEVALDVGAVTCGERSEAIAEVEIESLTGEPLAVFDVAEKLLETVAMRPSIVTKAQRGFRLADGEAERPVKARALKLEASMTPETAARAVIGAALAQLQRNENGVLAGDDPEFVHQMRVALRRLRAALRVFRSVVGRKRARRLDMSLRAVARTAGLARDWDVFETETLPALMEHLGEEREGREVGPQVKAHRDEARAAMRAALLSPAHARLILALARWLAEPHRPDDSEPLAAFAARAGAARHRKLTRRAEGLDPFDAPRRHKLRIEAKRLRYALDTFEGLFPPKEARAYLDALSNLQDDLGAANDAHVAAGLLEFLVIDPEPAQRARQHLGAGERAQAARLPAHLEAILGARRFWEA